MLRRAQDFYCGLGRDSGGTTGTLTGRLQVPSVLQDLILDSDQSGTVTAIRIGGQSVVVTDQAVPLALFDPVSSLEPARGAAIPLDANQEIQVDYALDAAGDISGGWGIDPWMSPAGSAVMPPPVNALGEELNYVGGLGEDAGVAAGSAWSLSAQMRRPCILGRLVVAMASAGGATLLEQTVREVQVNNLELLGGRAGATDEVGLHVFVNTAKDHDGLTLAYPVRTNDQVDVTGWNYSGAGTPTIRGAFFVLPGDAAAAAALVR